MKLAQILPFPVSRHEGVGGFAARLSESLRDKHSIETTWITRDQGDGREDLTTSSTLANRLAQISPDAVLLHYSGYGYAQDGCPRWLADGLGTWRRAHHNRPILTFFHEVYASGPPWTRACWSSRCQRRLAGELARLSDARITTLDLYVSRLRRLAPEHGIEVLPIASAVGEPASLRSGPRGAQLIVFGSPGLRMRAYRRSTLLNTLCERLDIEELIDIGPAIPIPKDIGARPIRPAGIISDGAVSNFLSTARAGILAYPAALLAKSTVFAAYAAHGLPCICSTRAASSDGLMEGLHYAHARRLAKGLVSLDALAANASSWYRGHDADRHGALIASLLAKDSLGRECAS